jgi:hypothetical protein
MRALQGEQEGEPMTALIRLYKPPVEEMPMAQRAAALDLVRRFREMEARGECRLIIVPLPSDKDIEL